MTEIADLTPLAAPPFWHPEAALPTTLPMVAVGWLGAEMQSTGTMPDEVIDRLVDAVRAERFFHDCSMGSHSCALCTSPARRPRERWRGGEIELYGHGFQIVEHEGRAFILPRLLLHYILSHGYRPPNSCVSAIRAGQFSSPPPLTAEQLAAIERQRQASSMPRSALRRELVSVALGLVIAGFAVGVWMLLTRR